MTENTFIPLSVGGIIDKSFRLYKQHFIRFLAIIALIQVPISLIMIMSQYLLTQGFAQGAQSQGAAGSGASALAGSILMFIGGALAMVGNMLAQAALVKSISESYRGHEVSVGDAYRFVLKRFWTLAGATILITLIMMVGYMFCVVPGIIWTIFYCLTIQAILVEDRGVNEGMRRSRDLVRGNMGRAFGLMFLLFCIALVVSMGFTTAGVALMRTLLSQAPVLGFMVQQGATAVAKILTLPISACATVLFYYDLRIRKEGFDLEMLAAHLDGESNEEI